ncbi:MAG: alanine racemase [Bdellovibrionota bacterium]
MQHRPTVAIINLKNIAHNYKVLRDLQKSQDLFYCPMIKADAYGHGATRVMQTLYDLGQRYFGVALLEEAIELREDFSNHRDFCNILVFAPLFEESLEAALQAQVTPVLSSWRELENLENALKQFDREDLKIKVHLKFNTGMARLGFDASEADALAKYFRKGSQLELEGVCTHLSDGEDAHLAGGWSADQIEKFAAIEKSFSGFKIFFHMFNSAGLIASSLAKTPQNHNWGARPGLSLYGVKPVMGDLSAEQLEAWKKIDLRPVMQVETQIVLTREIKKGEGVSYNRRWTSSQDSLIAVLPIGYADGYHRRLSNKGLMLVQDRVVPVVGTVCMDYTLVDVSALRENNQDLYGMSVIVIGQDQTQSVKAEDLAELVGTNAYEILTSVSRRVPRVYR